MPYQVLYRKYRPKAFSEVVGQDHIISVIQNQIRAGRVAHAYLFSGPRGVGKTTTARLIAKAVNCANAANISEGNVAAAFSIRLSPAGGGTKVDNLTVPCNICPSCEVFNSGRALNLIEIDAASNRGIDEIRELREAVRFAPPGGGTKAYIIDEVHQLTKEAFNALLKTLEEPPGHAIFILATTELERVPATVVSRTQHFDFRRPRREALRDRLLLIAEREGVKLAADAASAIAFAAEGSVRDAEGMLGKILAVEDRSVTLVEAEEILGIPKREALNRMFEAIGQKNLSAAIGLVNRLYRDGFEMEYLTRMLVSFFRDTLLAKTDPSFDPAASGSLLPDESRELAGHLAVYAADDLADAIIHLIEAIPAGRRSPIPQLPLELALIRIITGERDKSPR